MTLISWRLGPCGHTYLR